MHMSYIYIVFFSSSNSLFSSAVCSSQFLHTVFKSTLSRILDESSSLQWQGWSTGLMYSGSDRLERKGTTNVTPKSRHQDFEFQFSLFLCCLLCLISAHSFQVHILSNFGRKQLPSLRQSSKLAAAKEYTKLYKEFWLSKNRQHSWAQR